MAHGIAFYSDGTVKTFEHTTAAEREYAAARLKVAELTAARDAKRAEVEALDEQIETARDERDRTRAAAMRERF